MKSTCWPAGICCLCIRYSFSKIFVLLSRRFVIGSTHVIILTVEILFSKSPIIIFCRGHARVQGDRVHDIGARPEMGWIQWIQGAVECRTRASCPDPIASLSSHQTTSTLAFRTFLIILDYDGSTNWTKAVIKNEAEKQYYNNPPPLLQPNTRFHSTSATCF